MKNRPIQLLSFLVILTTFFFSEARAQQGHLQKTIFLEANNQGAKDALVLGADDCTTLTDNLKKATEAKTTCESSPPDTDPNCTTSKGDLDKAKKAAAKCPAQPATPAPSGDSSNDQTKLSAQIANLQNTLDNRKESDFELQLGIGSLIRNGDVTDYTNNTNILAATSLGSATPQYLVGVGMRTPLPNFPRLGPNKDYCDAKQHVQSGEVANEKADTQAKDKAQALLCPAWRQHPWSGFVSLKLAPQSSDSIVGYVLGGSFSAGHYLNLLMGFGLTPVSEPSHGLRAAASQYVTAQQKLGLLTTFDPVAMFNNDRNAFDGFSLLDTTGKLIYTGTPLETHYRGGWMIGVAVPIDFGSFLTGK